MRTKKNAKRYVKKMKDVIFFSLTMETSVHCLKLVMSLQLLKASDPFLERVIAQV